MTPAKTPTSTEDKHPAIWRTISGIIVAIAGCAGMLRYCLSESRAAMEFGHAAESTAKDVSNDLKVHSAKQEEHEKHLRISLDDMKIQQQKILDAVLEGK